MNEHKREANQAHLERLEIDQEILPYPGGVTIEVPESELRDKRSTEVFQAWLSGKIDTDTYFKHVLEIHDPQ